MGTKQGDVRERLVECIDLVKAGKMSAQDAQAVAKLAGQVTASMEAEARILMLGLQKPLGAMAIGHDTPLVHEVTSTPQLQSQPGVTGQQVEAEAQGSNTEEERRKAWAVTTGALRRATGSAEEE